MIKERAKWENMGCILVEWEGFKFLGHMNEKPEIISPPERLHWISTQLFLPTD